MLILSAKLILRRFRLIKLLCLFFGATMLSANGYSQPIDSSPASKIKVYSAKNRYEISQVNRAATYTVLQRSGNWLLVQFAEPFVPVWLSERFVRRDGNQVTVAAYRLNARMQPSLKAPVLATINKGYSSEVLASTDGFVKVYAPNSLSVAIVDPASSGSSEFRGWPNTVNNSELGGTVSQTSAVSGPRLRAVSEPRLRAVSETPLKAVSETPLNAVDETPAVTEKVPAEAVATASESTTPRSHKLAPGDSISVLIFGEPDLSVSNARIPENGQISFPLIGSIDVAGFTTRNIEDKLRSKYAQGYVKNPQLSITIFSYRPIFIRGGVRNTGAFPYTEGLTVAKALALAGGAKNSAATNGISILRDGKTVKTEIAIDSQDLIVSGDVITVAEEAGVSEESSTFIYLHGEVNIPGEYLYRKNLSVEKAIVLAGGFGIRASRKKVSVTRYIDGEEEPKKFKRVKLYFPVLPGDVISVGARLF